MYGPDGRWAFVPAAVGFALGGLGMVAVDYVMPMLGSPSPVSEFIEQHKKDDDAPGSGSQASGGAAAGGSSGNLRFRGKIADGKHLAAESLGGRDCTDLSGVIPVVRSERFNMPSPHPNSRLSNPFIHACSSSSHCSVIWGSAPTETGEEGSVGGQESPELVQKAAKRKSWHRIVLLVIAITLHK